MHWSTDRFGSSLLKGKFSINHITLFEMLGTCLQVKFFEKVLLEN